MELIIRLVGLNVIIEVIFENDFQFFAERSKRISRVAVILIILIVSKVLLAFMFLVT